MRFHDPRVARRFRAENRRRPGRHLGHFEQVGVGRIESAAVGVVQRHPRPTTRGVRIGPHLRLRDAVGFRRGLGSVGLRLRLRDGQRLRLGDAPVRVRLCFDPLGLRHRVRVRLGGGLGGARHGVRV